MAWPYSRSRRYRLSLSPSTIVRRTRQQLRELACNGNARLLLGLDQRYGIHKLGKHAAFLVYVEVEPVLHVSRGLCADLVVGYKRALVVIQER